MRMMHVRHMRVAVLQAGVLVAVRVRIVRRVSGAMRVLMMDIVVMQMVVLHGVVVVLVIMNFGEMQPDAARHQGARRQKLHHYRFAQE